MKDKDKQLKELRTELQEVVDIIKEKQKSRTFLSRKITLIEWRMKNKENNKKVQ